MEGLRQVQNLKHFADDIFKGIFMKILLCRVQDKARELATALEEKRGLQNRYLELQKKRLDLGQHWSR